MAQLAPSTTPNLSFTRVLDRSTGQAVHVNTMANLVDILLQGGVADKDLTAPPGSPAEGDAYIIAATATGDWAGEEDNITYYDENSVWQFITPTERFAVWIDDENLYYRFDGTNWVNWWPKSVEAGITASATQTQGQQPLTETLSVITTVGTASDVVTLPSAVVGMQIVVANDAATNTLQIFPASGDSIDGGSVDASVTLTAANRATFFAETVTNWIQY